MTEEKLERPKFLPSFLSALSKKAEEKTLWKFFIWPVVSFSIGGCVAYFMPAYLWSYDLLEVSVTVYAGLLTVNGLILALSWGAFSRIFQSISAPKFSSFLRRNDLLNNYIVTVSYVHGLQITAVLFSAVCLIFVLFQIEGGLYDRILFGLMISFSIYAIQQASNAVNIMYDLVWQKAIFDEHQEGDNIVSIGKKQE